MGNNERQAAEQEYVETAFDYARDPIGSERWCQFWKGWQARAKYQYWNGWIAEESSQVPCPINTIALLLEAEMERYIANGCPGHALPDELVQVAYWIKEQKEMEENSC